MMNLSAFPHTLHKQAHRGATSSLTCGEKLRIETLKDSKTKKYKEVTVLDFADLADAYILNLQVCPYLNK